MDSRVLDVWRLTWPKSIPVHEYETALQLAALVNVTGRKPEPATAPPTPTPTGNVPSDLMNATEAAKLLHVSSTTISNWAKSGKFRAYPKSVGRGSLFSRNELERLHAGPRLVHSESSQEAIESPPDAMTIRDAAKELGMGMSTVYAAVRSGRLKASATGAGRKHPAVISRADLEAFRTSQAVP